MFEDEDRRRLTYIALFVERAAKMSAEARFLLHAISQDRWTWTGLATDTAEDLGRLLKTVDEVLSFFGWVHHNFELGPQDARAAKKLTAELFSAKLRLMKILAETPWTITSTGALRKD